LCRQTGGAFEDRAALGGTVEQLGTLRCQLVLELSQAAGPIIEQPGVGIEPFLSLGEPMLAPLEVTHPIGNVLPDGASLLFSLLLHCLGVRGGRLGTLPGEDCFPVFANRLSRRLIGPAPRLVGFCGCLAEDRAGFAVYGVGPGR
jgi:hypothetical protein